MTIQPPGQPTGQPTACSLTAPALAERLDEFAALFASGYLGRERNEIGIRFRFTHDDRRLAWIVDLTAREKACCDFFRFTTIRRGDEIWLDTSVVDDDAARRVLDRFCELADRSDHRLDS